MKLLPALEYTLDARRDLRQCRQFLRRHSPGTVTRRLRELANGVRAVCEFPEMNRVREVLPGTGFELRRHNVGRFVIAYVYVRPDPAPPRGLVSLRGFRHAGMQDALWMVHDCSDERVARPLAWEFLSTRACEPRGPYQPLQTYGAITFTPDDPLTRQPARLEDPR